MSIAVENKVQTIGQHDAKMVSRLSIVVVKQWVALHRYARSGVPAQVKERVLVVLGGGIFEWCWAVNGIYQDSIQRYNPHSTARIKAHLSEPSVRPTICNKVCFTVSMISARMSTIALLAEKAEAAAAAETGKRAEAKSAEAKQLRHAYNFLFNLMYELLYTGALADMPNSSRCARIHEDALDRLVDVLPQRWEILKKHASSSGQVASVSSLIGETLRLPMFEAVLAQEEFRLEEGSESLKQWYLRPKARMQRGFYADMGGSIHALSQIAQKLRRYRAEAPLDSPRWRFANAGLGAVEKTLIEVLASGVLFHVP